MDFISTRGQVKNIGFLDAVLMGLADDGGLLIPSKIPTLSPSQLKAWEQLSYEDLAYEVFSLYIGDDIPEADLRSLIADSYATFRDSDITPIRPIKDNLFIMELFHGPTFAFKDVALQFLGNLYAYIAKKKNKTIHILGATSGDTGASAIEAVRGKEGIRICILHPHQKVSEVQELQMTTINDENVLNLSVEGTFDDCQHIIKELFADTSFKNEYHLRAINSINFARILAQTVYYFYAYFRIREQLGNRKLNFSVPTGNFGDIFAGFLAKKMGLPIHKLILATNENNILEQFITEGIYKPGQFHSTYSPSMDIQVASNFERYLYYLLDEDTEQVRACMEHFQTEGEIKVSPQQLEKVQETFAAYGVLGDECLQTIRRYYDQNDYLLDPHTACGVAAYEARNPDDEVCVTLSTAHPAKFNESIERCEIEQSFPKPIADLFDQPKFQEVVDADQQKIAERLKEFLS